MDDDTEAWIGSEAAQELAEVELDWREDAVSYPTVTVVDLLYAQLGGHIRLEPITEIGKRMLKRARQQ